MAQVGPDSLEGKSLEDLFTLVRGLIVEFERLRAENGEGRARVEALVRENLELRESGIEG